MGPGTSMKTSYEGETRIIDEKLQEGSHLRYIPLRVVGNYFRSQPFLFRHSYDGFYRSFVHHCLPGMISLSVLQRRLGTPMRS